MIKNKQLLFSLTKKDFKIQYFKGSGAGGQHRNKNETAVRIIHPDSGARGESQEYKSREQNKKAAFKRLVESKEFKKWHKLEVARRKGLLAEIEEEVEKMMKPENLKIEYL